MSQETPKNTSQELEQWMRSELRRLMTSLITQVHQGKTGEDLQKMFQYVLGELMKPSLREDSERMSILEAKLGQLQDQVKRLELQKLGGKSQN
jgi:hypothetical protein